eukprot:scaffold7214_cov410-Prasinococcus_capsulatus_cf.AAC.2
MRDSHRRTEDSLSVIDPAFGAGTSFRDRKRCKSTTYASSSDEKSEKAVPERPARAALPTRWTNSFALGGKSRLTTLSNSGMSIPLQASSYQNQRPFPTMRSERERYTPGRNVCYYKQPGLPTSELGNVDLPRSLIHFTVYMSYAEAFSF